MNSSLNNPFALVGRILLAALFLLAGFAKLTGFAGTVGYIASKGLPMPAVLAALTMVVELGAGAALLLGYQTRWAALALAGFTLIASFIFHNFWDAPADQQMVQNLMFMKNIAITGGLLMVVALGAGAWSLDARRIAV
jgi:putative oxidoreductase